MTKFSTTFKRVTASGPTQCLRETGQRGGVPKIAGGANWRAAGTPAVIVDHVIRKQDRKLVDRSPIDRRQEVESLFGVRGAGLIGGSPVERGDAAPPLEC